MKILSVNEIHTICQNKWDTLGQIRLLKTPCNGEFASLIKKLSLTTDIWINRIFVFCGRLKRVNGWGFCRQLSGVLQTCCYIGAEYMGGRGLEIISTERHSVYFSKEKLKLQTID